MRLEEHQGAKLLFKIKKLYSVLRKPLWARAFLRECVAAGAEHQIVLEHVGAMSCVVDIGANRGQFALVARNAFPHAMIYSFEPLPGPSKVYRRIFSGDKHVKLFAVAVGERSCDAIMHVSGRDDSSSLLPISKEQDVLYPGTAQASQATVAVRRLSDCIDPGAIRAPSLLKVDVQGFELTALRGCERELQKFSYVYVECSFRELYIGQALAHDVIAWLHERGFWLAGVYNMSFDDDGRPVQGDFLFSKHVS